MCKWQALDKIHLPTQSSETNSLSVLTGTCYTSQKPATSHIHIHKHTWSWIQSCDLTGSLCLRKVVWICIRPHRCKAWRLLSLHQRSFHCLFYVLPTATPITADSHRQPAYSIQECTFAAYIHVLHSTKHYQNSRKERNWHTPDCSLKPSARCVAALSTEQRVSCPQISMPLSALKKKHLHYSKKPPSQ